MSKNYHIAVLPGDGGPEVMTQGALKVLDAATAFTRCASPPTITM